MYLLSLAVAAEAAEIQILAFANLVVEAVAAADK
jgi:hypothetical protein